MIDPQSLTSLACQEHARALAAEQELERVAQYVAEIEADLQALRAATTEVLPEA